jgi:hypothetical protein
LAAGEASAPWDAPAMGGSTALSVAEDFGIGRLNVNSVAIKTPVGFDFTKAWKYRFFANRSPAAKTELRASDLTSSVDFRGLRIHMRLLRIHAATPRRNATASAIPIERIANGHQCVFNKAPRH